MSWAGSDTGRHRAAILERNVSWHVCVSGSSVGQSAGLVVVIAWSRVRLLVGLSFPDPSLRVETSRTNN